MPTSPADPRPDGSSRRPTRLEQARARIEGRPEGPPTTEWAAPVDDQDQRGPDESWQRRDTLSLYALALLALVWAIAAVWVGAPVLSRPWSWWGLVPLAGLCATAYAIRALVGARQRAPRAVVGGALVMPLVLFVSFCWGVANSVVVDGRVFLETSSTARSYRLSSQLVEDLAYFEYVDTLLGLDPSQARARFRELEPAQREMESISARWELTDPSQLPDGEFAPLVTNAAAAAFSGSQALESKRAQLGTDDERVAAELQVRRGDFVANASAIAPRLASLAADEGFELPRPSERP